MNPIKNIYYRSIMDSLPIEVLTHVFGVLGTQDLLTVLRVCTKWRDVCGAMQRVQLLFGYAVKRQREPYCTLPEKMLANITESFGSISVLDVSFCIALYVTPMAVILKKIGKHLESLSIAHCRESVGRQMLPHITKHCGRNLRALDVSGCCVTNQPQSTHEWNAFVAACPNVKELLMNDCNGWEGSVLMLMNNLKLEKLHCVGTQVIISKIQTVRASRETMKELVVGHIIPIHGENNLEIMASVIDFPNLERFGVYSNWLVNCVTSILKCVRESNKGTLKCLHVGDGARTCALREIEQMESVRTLQMHVEGHFYYSINQFKMMLKRMVNLEQLNCYDKVTSAVVSTIESTITVNWTPWYHSRNLPSFVHLNRQQMFGTDE
jgi:hypothetical protein